eukprot:TRINITY_DN7065_c1_g2_i1.p1 TRINITY_DN7065_c1_g2~~TRINITY_DN7065_c1_g2_i1.p1  ORF type:complete len:332 (-),score=46.12 TRINITY_DN7065_c1_g2_i1:285-1145(-)
MRSSALPALRAAGRGITGGISSKQVRTLATSSPLNQGGADSSQAGQQEQPEQQSSSLPRVAVFGGNGFVGSRICQEVLNTGMGVISINRSGRPTNISEAWVNDVEWVTGDALDESTYKSKLLGCAAAISSVGAFGTNEYMLKVNGQSNINAIKAAKDVGVPRFVYIAVHEYGLPSFVLNGYFQGKKDAENFLKETYGEQGVTLKPGFITGGRKVGAVTVPINIIGDPLKQVLGYLPTKDISKFPVVGAGFVPPVKVEQLAKVAVTAALDPEFGRQTLDVWEINEYN